MDARILPLPFDATALRGLSEKLIASPGGLATRRCQATLLDVRRAGVFDKHRR